MNTKNMRYPVFFMILGAIFVALWGCNNGSTSSSGPEWDKIPAYPALEAGYESLFAPGAKTEAELAALYSGRYATYGILDKTEVVGGSPVYFTRDVSAAGIEAVYKALGSPIPKGAKTAVKLNMAEAGHPNVINPNYIEKLVKDVNGTLVDSTTFYDVQMPGIFGGTIGDPMFLSRGTAALYRSAAQTNGFTEAKFGKIDILNETGLNDEWSTATPNEWSIPITDYPGRHLENALLGANIQNYDWLLSIVHFKAHSSAGYGGVFKNFAIGMATYNGKKDIHQNGDPAEVFFTTVAEPFQEKVVEYNQALMQNTKFKNKIVYINMLNNIADNCDCQLPMDYATGQLVNNVEMLDIGILASLDPVALEKASLDLIFDAADKNAVGAKHVKERILAFRGPHQVLHAAKLKLGHLQYELIDIDKK
ncbi:DUF362 domain-containing protein [Leadbettera azotonutricia]|uniref:Putative lipoprotein n=1 Tax=Leadbettera azotonutricia (strain ATCC BAA-888 / DSM 13862 / ZAS-9) TaxID=545695 RepID=F5YBV2_LEAAZ|nr:DUF362 domain-containing protein [Leadbettera azotonutricia]AEF81820.1 putative lipoprotein [Leadbettera azotonutricia ZAS-9]